MRGGLVGDADGLAVGKMVAIAEVGELVVGDLLGRTVGLAVGDVGVEAPDLAVGDWVGGVVVEVAVG